MTQKHVTTERVAVTKTGIGFTEEKEKQRLKQEDKKSKQIKELDIGRILIKEIPEEKKHIPRMPDKEIVKPKTVEVTMTDQMCQHIPVQQLKDSTCKASEPDVHHLQNEFVDSKAVKERIKSYTEKKAIHATIENVTVTKAEFQRRKEPKTQKYPKHLDIGRIVIEEISDKKEQTPKEDNLRRERLEPKITEVTITQFESEKQREQRSRFLKALDIGRIIIKEMPEEKIEIPQFAKNEKVPSKCIEVTLPGQDIDEISSHQIREDAFKMGKFDETDFEKQSMEFSTVQEETRIHKDKEWTHQHETKSKVTAEDVKITKDLDIGRIVVDEIPPKTEDILKRDNLTKEHFRSKSFEVTTNPNEDEAEEKEERPDYVQAHDVGRIVIEEHPDKKKKVAPVPRKPQVPGDEAEKISGEHIIEDIVEVGKRDVTSFEKKSVEFGTFQQQPRVYKDWTQKHETIMKLTAGDATRTKEQEKLRSTTEIGGARLLVQELHRQDENILKHDVSSKQPLKPKSTEVTISQHKVEEEREERPKYLNALDVGRIVIKEIPDEKKKAPTVPKKEIVKPKSIEVTVSDLEVEKNSTRRIIEDVVKVGKLEITDVEKQTVQEKTRIHEDWTHKHESKTKVTLENATKTEELQKPLYPKKQKIERISVDEIPEQHEDVPERDVSEQLRPKNVEVTITQQECEKHRERSPRYVKSLDVGRIVIKEIPEEKEKAPPLPKKEKVRQKSIDVTLPDQEVEELPREYIAEDVVKVGTFDVTDFEKHFVKSSIVQNTTKIYKDYLQRHEIAAKTKTEHPKTINEQEKYSKGLDFGHIVVEEALPQFKDNSKRDVLSKEQLRPKSVVVSITQHEVEKKTKERPSYLKPFDVGRIMIEENPEKKEIALPVPKKEKVRPKSVEVSVLEQEVEETPGRHIIGDVVKDGKFDSTDFEKKSVKPSTVQEENRIFKDWTHKYETVTAEDATTAKEFKKSRYSKELDIGLIMIEEVPLKNEDISKHGVLSKEKVRPKSIEELIAQHEVEEKTEKRPRYVKALDVGRIVIEENPEDKKKLPQMPKEEKVRPKSMQITLPEKEIEETSKERVIPDVINAGKLDVVDFKEQSLERSTVQGRTNISEVLTQNHETKQVRPKSTEVTITRHDVEERRDESPRYVKALDVERIVIEEIPEEKEKAPLKQNNEKVDENVEDVQKKYIKVKDLEKEVAWSRTVNERKKFFNDTVDGIPKVFLLLSNATDAGRFYLITSSFFVVKRGVMKYLRPNLVFFVRKKFLEEEIYSI